MNKGNVLKKENSLKSRIYPLKFNSLYIKNNYNFSEYKRDEINQSSSQSIINSNRYITYCNNSFYDSKKLHIIKQPYKFFMPLRTKMKNIKKSRALTLNNYYKRTLKNELLSKDIMTTDSFNAKNNNSKNFIKKTPNIHNIKSNVELSNSNQNNISKNAFLSTERNSTVKERNNNLSKYNIHDKFIIFSYKSKKSILKNSKYKITNKSSTKNKSNITNSVSTTSNKKEPKNRDIANYNDCKILKFLNMNQGYKNLSSFGTCVNNFTVEVQNLTREKYMNFFLQEYQATLKAQAECNNDGFKIEMKKKLDNKNLFDIFFNDYKVYHNKLNMKKIKDTDYISLLKWEIISYKNEVNRLNDKKDKLLAKLNKYIKMKYFLITMKNYSLDKKDDSWMFNKESRKNNDYSNLIKEKRRIVAPEEHRIENRKKLFRRASAENRIGSFNEIILNEDKSQPIKKRAKRTNSFYESNPLGGSAIKEIATILNNHIANLLIYNNQLRTEIEPLKEEFNRLYDSLKKNEEKKNQLLQLEFIIYPEKKRIAKDRYIFLTNSLFNLNNIIYNSSNYYKINKVIQDKLYSIYKTLLDHNIIPLTYLKASNNGNIIEQILFYLKNIEKGIDHLFKRKKILMENYPILFNEITKEIHLEMKIKTLEAQKKKEAELGNKQINKIVDRMRKSLFSNKRKDYYEYGFKRKKKKKIFKIIDPYDELRYIDDNSKIKNE